MDRRVWKQNDMFYNCLRARSLIRYLLSFKSSFSFTYTVVAFRQVSWPFDNLYSNVNLVFKYNTTLIAKSTKIHLNTNNQLIMASIIGN